MSILVTGGAGFDWAVAKGVPLIVGDTGDQNLVVQIIREHKVHSVIHFAAWLVVPDSVKDPLGYYKNNGAGNIEVAQYDVTEVMSRAIPSAVLGSRRRTQPN
jgi:UDP-glucose 4-epimerase